MKTTMHDNGVGSIMYGMLCNKSNFPYVVSVVNMYMIDPGRTH